MFFSRWYHDLSIVNCTRVHSIETGCDGTSNLVFKSNLVLEQIISAYELKFR